MYASMYVTYYGYMAPLNEDLMDELFESVDQIALPNYLCTIHRTQYFKLDSGVFPKPTALITANSPCDGQRLFHETIKQHKYFRDVPSFDIDPPYKDDDRSIKFFAEEIWNLIDFLEKHTGKKFKMSELKKVIDETSIQ